MTVILHRKLILVYEWPFGWQSWILNVWLRICSLVENLLIYNFVSKISSYPQIFSSPKMQSGRLGIGRREGKKRRSLSRNIARSRCSNSKYSQMWARLQKPFKIEKRWDFWPQIFSDLKVSKLNSELFDHCAIAVQLLCIRVASIVAHHDELLTQWRYI